MCLEKNHDFRNAKILTDKEYRLRMEKLGWSKNYIDSQLRLRDEMEKEGIIMPLEADLIEAPINNL